MTHFPDLASFTVQPLAVSVYNVLRRSLLAQAKQPETIVLTEADFHGTWHQGQGWSQMTLWVTPDAQGLLLQAIAPSETASTVCSVAWVTAPRKLVPLLTSLRDSARTDIVEHYLTTALNQLSDRTEEDCGHFLLGFLPTLLSIATHPDSELVTAAQCLPVQAALDRQQEQSLLLNQVIAKIRQSLDLKAILATTVEEVRQVLQVDRLVIYQFKLFSAGLDPAPPRGAADPTQTPSPHQGYITYEALASDRILSVMHFSEESCFQDTAHCRQKYLTGNPIAIADVRTAYQDAPCLLNFLERAQVRAKLIAPILVQGELWGLLIAHHCTYPHAWQAQELSLLQQIAEHLSVAIQQASLYAQLQAQTQSLETCVINRTQDLRDALAAAQTANLAKSEFLATMSHELRTPLTCIIGLSATLLRWSLGDLNARQRSYLQTIHDSGERLLAIINDILEMSKIEAGRAVLEVRAFSLTKIAQQALDPFRQEARDRDIELVFESTLLADQDTFTGDPRRTQQILDNLLSNALKFTRNGGQVNLRVRRENQQAVFQVEDTGIGIDEAQIPQLFEKFQQLEASRQRQYSGTGLGLALTKQLVELHGGTISVNSRRGVGSVFTVRLPMQRLDALPDRSHRLDSNLSAKPIAGRIVLVEEQDELAGMVCDLLTAADYQVIWVIEGSGVVEQVALLQPTVVIINFHLSGTNCQHIIQALRDSLVTSEIKILVLQRHQDPPESLKGADAYLTLPLDPEQLLEQVNALSAIAMTSFAQG